MIPSIRQLLFLPVCLAAGAAVPEPARPFSHHMVLPMGKEVPVHGTADPGSPVQIRFADAVAETRADKEGKWRVKLPPMAASKEGRDLEIQAGAESVVLKDILVGRVWLCSGQSNMDFPLHRAIGGPEEAASAGKYDGIRIFDLAGAPTDGRTYDEATLARLERDRHFQGKWEKSPAAGKISAVAWWTARLVHERDGVPVGIVENAVGGSGTEAWLPRATLESWRGYRPLLDDHWLESDRVSAWARGRAKQNLGSHTTANHPFRPGFLFESGVSWWAGFPFEAVLWYQGETNAEMNDDAWNGRLIRDLVTGWRRELGQPDLPFYMVQLPRIGGSDPLRRHWPAYREVQARAARALKGVTLVVTQDLGWDSPDVHPPDKLPVARRLAEAIPAPRR